MMRKTREFLIFSGTILILFVLMLFSLNSYGTGSRIYGHAGSLVDPAVEKILVNNSRESYLLWEKRGLRGRIIVSVTDQWKRIDLKRYRLEDPLYRSYPLKFYNISDEKRRRFLDDRNVLYMAAIGGLARQATAVLSDRGFTEISRQAERAKDVIFSPGKIYFPFDGFPRLFTTAARFRNPGEPVILFVSAAYFKEDDPEALYRSLFESGITTDCIVLCREEGDDSVNDRERAELVRFAKLIGMETDDKDM